MSACISFTHSGSRSVGATSTTRPGRGVGLGSFVGVGVGVGVADRLVSEESGGDRVAGGLVLDESQAGKSMMSDTTSIAPANVRKDKILFIMRFNFLDHILLQKLTLTRSGIFLA